MKLFNNYSTISNLNIPQIFQCSEKTIENCPKERKGDPRRSIIPNNPCVVAGNRSVFNLEGQRARVLFRVNLFTWRGRSRQSHEVFREGGGLEIVLLNVN